jgi:hypothetical protein
MYRERPLLSHFQAGRKPSQMACGPWVSPTLRFRNRCRPKYKLAVRRGIIHVRLVGFTHPTQSLPCEV